MEPAMPAKLPVWKTVFESFRFTFDNAAEISRYSWPYVLLYLTLAAVMYWANHPMLAKFGDPTADVKFLEFVSFVLPGFVAAFLGALVAVPWHRRMLLGEDPSASKMRLSLATRYSLCTIASVVLFIPAIIVSLFVDLAILGENDVGTWQYYASWAVNLISLATALLVLVRFCLVLPAIAISNSDTSVRRSWKLTEKSTMRLLAVTTLAQVPAIMLSYAIALAGGAEETQSRLAYTLTSTASDLIYFTAGMTIVTALSLAYRHFTGLPEPRSEAATPPAP